MRRQLLARTELLHDELLQRWEKQKQHSAERQEQGRQRLETSIRAGQKEVRQLIGGSAMIVLMAKPPEKQGNGCANSRPSPP